MTARADELQDGALCSLLDVAKRVPGYEPGNDEAIDETLNGLILQESEDYLAYVNREIIVTASDANADSDDDPTTGSRVFELDEFVGEERELAIGDAAAVTAVIFTLEDGTVVQTLDDAAWVALPRNRKFAWTPIQFLGFPLGVAAPAQLPRGHHRHALCGQEGPCRMLAAVTGTWGFPEIPTVTRQGVATLAILRYLNDVAAAGTVFAELANQQDFNLGGWLTMMFGFRERLRVGGCG